MRKTSTENQIGFQALESFLCEGEAVPSILFEDGTSFFPEGGAEESEDALFSTEENRSASTTTPSSSSTAAAFEQGTLRPVFMADDGANRREAEGILTEFVRTGKIQRTASTAPKPTSPQQSIQSSAISRLMPFPVSRRGALSSIRFLLERTPQAIHQLSKEGDSAFSDLDGAWTLACLALCWSSPLSPALAAASSASEFSSIGSFLRSKLLRWSVSAGDRALQCRHHRQSQQQQQQGGGGIGSEKGPCLCSCQACCPLAVRGKESTQLIRRQPLICCCTTGRLPFGTVAIEALEHGWGEGSTENESLELAISKIRFLSLIGDSSPRASTIASAHPCHSRQAVLYIAAARWEEAASALCRVPGTSIANLCDFFQSESSSTPFVAFLAITAIFCTHKDIHFTGPLDRLLTTALLWACGTSKASGTSSAEGKEKDELWGFRPGGDLGKVELPPSLGGGWCGGTLQGASTHACARHLALEPHQIVPTLRSIAIAPDVLGSVALEMAFQLVERCASRSALDDFFSVSPFSDARSGGAILEKPKQAVLRNIPIPRIPSAPTLTALATPIGTPLLEQHQNALPPLALLQVPQQPAPPQPPPPPLFPELPRRLVKPSLRLTFASARGMYSSTRTTVRALSLAGLVGGGVQRRVLEKCIFELGPQPKNGDISRWLADAANQLRFGYTLSDAVAVAVHLPRAAPVHLDWVLQNLRACDQSDIAPRFAALMANSLEVPRAYQLLNSPLLTPEARFELLLRVLGACQATESADWVRAAVTSAPVAVQAFSMAESLADRYPLLPAPSSPITRMCDALLACSSDRMLVSSSEVLAGLLGALLHRSAAELLASICRASPYPPGKKLSLVVQFVSHPSVAPRRDFVSRALRAVVAATDDRQFLSQLRTMSGLTPSAASVAAVADVRLFQLKEQRDIAPLIAAAIALATPADRQAAIGNLIKIADEPAHLQLLRTVAIERLGDVSLRALASVRLAAVQGSALDRKEVISLTDQVAAAATAGRLHALLDAMAPLVHRECKVLRLVADAFLAAEPPLEDEAADILRRVSDISATTTTTAASAATTEGTDGEDTVDHHALWGEALYRLIFQRGGADAVITAAMRSIRRATPEGFRRAIEASISLREHGRPADAAFVLRRVIALAPASLSAHRAAAIKELVRSTTQCGGTDAMTAFCDECSRSRTTSEIRALTDGLLIIGAAERAADVARAFVGMRRYSGEERVTSFGEPVATASDVAWILSASVRAGVTSLAETVRLFLESPAFRGHPEILAAVAQETWRVASCEAGPLVLICGCHALVSYRHRCGGGDSFAESLALMPCRQVASQALWLIRIACEVDPSSSRKIGSIVTRIVKWSLAQLSTMSRVPDLLFFVVRGVAEFREEDLALDIGFRVLKLMVAPLPSPQSQRRTGSSFSMAMATTAGAAAEGLQEFLRWMFLKNEERRRCSTAVCFKRIAELTTFVGDRDMFMDFAGWALAQEGCGVLLDAVLTAAEAMGGFCSAADESTLVNFESTAARLLYIPTPEQDAGVHWGAKDKALRRARWMLELARRAGDIRVARKAAESIFTIEPTLAAYAQLAGMCDSDRDRLALRDRILQKNLTRSLAFEILVHENMSAEALSLLKNDDPGTGAGAATTTAAAATGGSAGGSNVEDEVERARMIAAAAKATVGMTSDFAVFERELQPLLTRMLWRPWCPVSTYRIYTVSQEVDSYLKEALDILEQKWPSQVAPMQRVHEALSSARNMVMITPSKANYDKLVQHVGRVHDAHERHGRLAQFWAEYSTLLTRQANRPRCVTLLEKWRKKVAKTDATALSVASPEVHPTHQQHGAVQSETGTETEEQSPVAVAAAAAAAPAPVVSEPQQTRKPRGKRKGGNSDVPTKRRKKKRQQKRGGVEKRGDDEDEEESGEEFSDADEFSVNVLQGSDSSRAMSDNESGDQQEE